MSHEQRWGKIVTRDFHWSTDPYVKVWLYFGDKRVEKRKTPVYKCTLEPVFNETFTFNVPWEKIRECSLDVRVMDFDNIGRNELIGRISLTGKPSRTQHYIPHDIQDIHVYIYLSIYLFSK